MARQSADRLDCVLCWGPIEDQANDSIRFRIEAHPHALTKERDCVLAIQRSALTQESRSHMLAWAAGFKAIEALSSLISLTRSAQARKGFLFLFQRLARLQTNCGIMLRDYAERASRQRHFAAHRGSVMPGKLLEKLDEEPTEEDLDKEIGQLGLDRDLAYFPEGPIRDWAKSLLRYKVRLSKHKEIAEGVVLIEIKDKWGFIIPMADMEWNFQKFHNFMTKVLRACEKRI